MKLQTSYVSHSYYSKWGGAWLLAAALGSHGTVGAQGAGTPTGDRPNVLLIYADDLGYGDLSPYGATRVATPNVERLVREGVRHTNMHAVASTSTPSRYSLLTGEYAWRRKGTDVAAGNAGMIIRPEQFTLADLMRAAGYRTGAVGKWHLGLGDKTGEQDWNAPLAAGVGDLGFDYSYVMAATADRVPCVFIENGMVADYDPSAPIEVSYREPFEGEPTGRDNPELLAKQRPSHGHDQAIVNGISRIGYMRGGGGALWRDEDIADSIAAHAVGFVEEAVRRGQPFFLYLATNDVHVPRMPHERFRGSSPMGLRGEAIVQFDWTVGRMLEALDSLGLRDNTLIIMSSDNGPVVDDGYADGAEELLGDHRPGGPFRGGKYSKFEAGTAVPAIVSWPAGGVPQGMVSDALGSQIDWIASLGTLVGNTEEGGDAEGTGRRLVPRGAAPDSRDALAALLGRSGEGRDWVAEMAYDRTLSLRTPRWKYIAPSGSPAVVPWGTGIETGCSTGEQLFDMASPYEAENVAGANAEVTARLREMLEAISEDNPRHGVSHH